MTDDRSGALPGFVIIGAAKAATTWLRNQLSARPDVFLPKEEPHFFSREYGRGVEWYRSLFQEAAGNQIIGEKSADYLADPAAPERMARLLPAARLVVQLRNPVERAYSDYCMLYRRGSVGADISSYLGSRPSNEPRFLEDGLYFKHISRFLDWYPASQLSAITYDDIRSRPEQMVAEIATFLDLPDLSRPVPLVPNANVKDAPLLPLRLRQALAPAKKWAAPLRSQAWFKAIHGKLAREIAYPPLTADLRASMQDRYAGDVEQLGKLLGRDLSHWLLDARASNNGAARAA
jgi:hypothetical protein